MAKISLTRLQQMKQQGEKIAMLTVYDATFAALQASADIDMLLVGDSLGMVLQGHDTTLPVTLADMLYHVRAVKRGAPQGFIVADMPFLTYSDVHDALHHAGQLLQAGAAMVKIEGGEHLTPIVQALHQQGIPVCAHLGLTPQFIHQFGGYKVQGKAAAAEQIVITAEKLQAAGADMLLLECVPASLGGRISAQVKIPVIGIGAGPACDGQVLVMHDMLGANLHPLPRFVKNFLADQKSLLDAFIAYRDAVKNGSFPSDAHSYLVE
jgi:3-methyl-2-oxobutanoate hydroxymethyltransferase